MTKDAFTYALNHVPVPKGKTLWIYGDASGADSYTPFQDKAASLQGRGQTVFSVPQEVPGGYEAVMVNCPKQQEEAEGLIALAMSRSHGFVMAVAANDAGGNRLSKIFDSYNIVSHHLSKYHCKIVYTFDANKADRAIIERELSLLTPHQLNMGGKDWWTVPGLFGWNKIDPGSQLLVEHLPKVITGKVADFGCGFGYLTAHLLANAPGVISVDAYDLDARAVEATARNSGGKATTVWQDIRSFEPKPIYDMVVINPPFHSGKEEDIGLGESFIRKGWESLHSGGQLFMVANRNLPYEHIVKQMQVVHAEQGYKIMAGRKP